MMQVSKLVKISFSALVITTLILPILVLILSPIINEQFDVELAGVEEQGKRASFSYKNLITGKFQRRFERWFKRRVFYWPYLVKSDNQLNYWFFRQLSANYNSTAILGKDDFLIERAYLNSANKLHVAKLSRLDKRAKELSVLQQALSENGISFLLLISANKPSLYPEYIPDRFLAPGIENRQNAYDLFLPLLNKYKINHLDGPALLRRYKQQGHYPLFAHSGTHWNDYGSCLITRHLIEKNSSLIGRTTRSFNCLPVVEKSIPSFPDRDLVRIANLWFPESTYRSAPKPLDTTLVPDNAYRPRAVFVGTSFMWSVFRYLDKHKIFKAYDFFYYFNTHHFYPHRPKRKVERSSIKWKKLFKDTDLVIFEVNEAYLHKAGYGFARLANQHFKTKALE